MDNWKNFVRNVGCTGGCDKKMFNTWLAQVLLPQLSPDTTVVMDNAAFHKSTLIKQLIEGAKCQLLYLPTYSTDLNLIEHCWHTIKSILRSRMDRCKDLQLLVGDIIM